MDLLDFAGQSLDNKYHIERELGRGGMGTVYLATHLGTERPVAVKIISPQFMERAEFVERFRREARAAGRLRHPNVVNVTDFGFADTGHGQVAYLVMEYLDGCTLGEILEEEHNLPVGWTLDILEQVCSAVHEAHTQGIIHRDLKPDNIWLEPNQRGGYTVKVLDFGIAKLEEQVAAGGINSDQAEVFKGAAPTFASSAKVTLAGMAGDGTHVDAMTDTQVSESVTIAQTADHAARASEAGTVLLDPVDTEGQTAILNDGDISADYQDTIGTKVISEQVSTGLPQKRVSTGGHSLYESKNSAELTRVGAVLGTPLYMSPEQCRGDHLDPRSDIYSLGVIAYQMLSGAPPFEGDFQDVMESHKSVVPEPLAAKKVRRKMRRAIDRALSKDPQDRPQTAEGFASLLRARSEGIFGLLRRALVIYSEHLPKFLVLTGFFSIPLALLTFLLLFVSFLKVSGLISDPAGNALIGIVSFIMPITSAFCNNLLEGTIAWIVTQYLSVPLRPIHLRPALKEARKKWKRMAAAGFLTAILPFFVMAAGCVVGFVALASLLTVLYPITGSTTAAIIAGACGAVIFGALGLVGAHIFWKLVPPVVMMENVGVIAALRRSRVLVWRSFWTAAGAFLITVMIPAALAGSISYIVIVTDKAFDPKPQTPAAVEKPVNAAAGSEITNATETAPAADPADVPAVPSDTGNTETEKKPDVNVGFGPFNIGRTHTIPKTEEMDMRTKVKETLLNSLIQVFLLPMQILVFSFSGIIVALLYLKTRLAGGESMNDLIERFEDDGRPRKKWQERVRERLIQSGRIPSKP